MLYDQWYRCSRTSGIGTLQLEVAATVPAARAGYHCRLDPGYCSIVASWACLLLMAVYRHRGSVKALALVGRAPPVMGACLSAYQDLYTARGRPSGQLAGAT